MSKQVEIKFKTLTGTQTIVLTVGEALKSEVAQQVQYIINQADSGVVGGTFNVNGIGRVEINVIDRGGK